MTKGAATDMFDLQPPRHISTLRSAAGAKSDALVRGGCDLFPRQCLGRGVPNEEATNDKPEPSA